MLAHIASRDLTAARGHASRCARHQMRHAWTLVLLLYAILFYNRTQRWQTPLCVKKGHFVVIFHLLLLKETYFCCVCEREMENLDRINRVHLFFLTLRSEPWRTHSDLNKQIPKVGCCFDDTRIQIQVIKTVDIVAICNIFIYLLTCLPNGETVWRAHRLWSRDVAIPHDESHYSLVELCTSLGAYARTQLQLR